MEWVCATGEGRWDPSSTASLLGWPNHLCLPLKENSLRNRTSIHIHVQYCNMAYKHLEDASTYLSLPSDPTRDVVDGLTNYITHLKNCGVIDDSTANFLLLPVRTRRGHNEYTSCLNSTKDQYPLNLSCRVAMDPPRLCRPTTITFYNLICVRFRPLLRTRHTSWIF